MMSALDISLLNIVSFCGGVLSTFLFIFCCGEQKRFESIATRNYIDSAMNHQKQIIYPSAPTIGAIGSIPL
jgi:hypothetical protein